MQEIEFQAGARRLKLNKTRIMGILNCTPDSFSDGGHFSTPEQAVARGLEMLAEGADIIDIGGQSTRPGHTRISPAEEWRRIAGVVKALAAETDAWISVDTFYPQVAKKALEAGAQIINDVSGFGKDMLQAVADTGCGCIVMHPQGSGGGDILQEVHGFFLQRLEMAGTFGIDPARLCFDPGIGFGKTYEENLKLLAHVGRTKIPGCAYLMAASRKRVIGEPAGNPPFVQRMPGTVAAHTVAQWGGADILRVHDVREAVQAAAVCDALMKV